MSEQTDSDVLSSLVAPFRQAQSLLGQVTNVAQSLAGDTLFGEVMAGLSSLPSAASVNPLQSAQSLPVDNDDAKGLAANETGNPEIAGGGFIAALQAKARSTPLSNPAKGSLQAKGASGKRAQSTPSTPGRFADALQSSALPSPLTVMSGLLNDAQQQASTWLARDIPAPGRVLQDALRATRGSWAALDRIAELVQWLESDAAPRRDAFTGNNAATAKNALPKGASSASMTSSVRGSAGEQLAQTPSALHRQSGTRGEDAVIGHSFLQDLVDAAWNAATGAHGQASRGRAGEEAALAGTDRVTGSGSPDVRSARGSTPAPRGQSMLNPQLSTRPGDGGTAGTQQTSSSNRSSVTAGATSERSMPPNRDVINDDDLAERLNRALIEQAWRGGVDLT